MSEPIELVRASYDQETRETTYRVRDHREKDWNIIAPGPITFKKITKKVVPSGEMDSAGKDVMRDAYMVERDDVVATAAVWHAVAANGRRS